MKIIIMCLFVIVSVNANAGEVNYSAFGKNYRLDNCLIISQYRSDINNYTQIRLDCGDQLINPIIDDRVITKTSVYLKDKLALRCPSEYIINSAQDFYIYLSCSDLIFNASFD